MKPFLGAPANSRRALSADELADLRMEFESCDSDQDGRISYVEFERLLDTLGSTLSRSQRRKEFSQIDTDLSGSIDLPEFQRWCEDG